MRILVDTNVLLDVLLARPPWATDAARVWYLAETTLTGYVSVLSYANAYYVIRRAADRETADKALRLLRATFHLVAFDQGMLDQSLASDFPDFEDAVQYVCARKARVECILTRDAGHFASSAIPVLSPDQFLATYSFE
jgi:predicted nucleic acid-binding protein